MTKVFPRAPHLWSLGFSCPLKWGRRQWFSFCFCHKEVAALTSILASLAPFYWAHHSSRRTSVWDEDGGRSPTLWQGSQVPPWNTLEVASWWRGLFSVTVQHGCETSTFLPHSQPPKPGWQTGPTTVMASKFPPWITESISRDHGSCLPIRASKRPFHGFEAQCQHCLGPQIRPCSVSDFLPPQPLLCHSVHFMLFSSEVSRTQYSELCA